MILVPDWAWWWPFRVGQEAVTELLSAVKSTTAKALLQPAAALRWMGGGGVDGLLVGPLDTLGGSLKAKSFLTAWGLAAPWNEIFASSSLKNMYQNMYVCVLPNLGLLLSPGLDNAEEVLLTADGVGLGFRLRNWKVEWWLLMKSFFIRESILPKVEGFEWQELLM